MTDTLSIYSYANESQDLLGHEVSSLIAEGDLLNEPMEESRLQCDNQHIDDKVIPCSFFKDIHDPGWGKQFADLQKTPHTWSMLVEICRMCSQRPLQQKTDSRLICPTIFTPTVRKRPTPKKIRKPNGEIFEKHWYDGWRCDENVTEIGMIIPDLDDDFEFETVYSWLIGEGIEALLWTTASHTFTEPRLRLVIPLAETVDAQMYEMVLNSIVACIRPGYRIKDTTKSKANSLAYFPAQYESADESRFVHTRGRVYSAEEWFRRGGLTMQEAVREKKARRASGVRNGTNATTSKDWPLSRDVVWNYDEARERYKDTERYRHPALCGFATAVAMRAFHAGYDLDVAELADIIENAQDENTPSSPYDDVEQLAADAIAYAEANIGEPAFIQWNRTMEEVRAGGFLEPQWPKGWQEQAAETIYEIQTLRNKEQKTLEYDTHFEECNIDNQFATSAKHSIEAVFSNKRTINVRGGDLADIVVQAEQLLVESGLPIYQRDGKIVRIGQMKRHKKTPGLSFIEMTEAAVRTLLTKHARWRKWDGRLRGFKVVDCPKEIATALLAETGNWQLLPVCRAVATTPIFRADGTILDTPGYDEATAIYFDPQGIEFFKVNDQPTREEARAALDVLIDLVAEVPFVKHETHGHINRSVLLAAILSIVARPDLPTVPGFAFDAPTAGSGKSMLADLLAYIASGRAASARTLGKDEETEKRLAAALRSGTAVVCFDNITGEIDNDMLCQAISQQLVTFRILSKTEERTVENAAIFLLTGNNLMIIGDLVRRILRCTIDPQCERPEEREFKTVRPDKLAAQNGPAYVFAALTCLRAFHIAGRPSTTKPLGTFEDWSELVRDCLIWLGEPDPCLVINEVRFADPSLSRNEAALYAWYEKFGGKAVMTKEVVETAREKVDTNSGEYKAGTIPGFRYAELRDALLAVTDNDLNSTTLGNWAGSIKNRVIGEYQIIPATKSRGYPRWRVPTLSGFHSMGSPCRTSVASPGALPFPSYTVKIRIIAGTNQWTGGTGTQALALMRGAAAIETTGIAALPCANC